MRSEPGSVSPFFSDKSKENAFFLLSAFSSLRLTDFIELLSPPRMLFLCAAATTLVATSSRVGCGAGAPAVSWRQSAVAPAPRLGQLTLNSETAVVDALTKLFKAFDSNGDGFVTLSTMLLADRSAAATGGEWESRQARVGLGSGGCVVGGWMPSKRRALFARQARVGSRRLRRLFADKKKLSQEQFVGILEEEFNRRIARGLSIGRAVLEIQVNMPLEGMLAAEYGNE